MMGGILYGMGIMNNECSDVVGFCASNLPSGKSNMACWNLRPFVDDFESETPFIEDF